MSSGSLVEMRTEEKKCAVLPEKNAKTDSAEKEVCRVPNARMSSASLVEMRTEEKKCAVLREKNAKTDGAEKEVFFLPLLLFFVFPHAWFIYCFIV